MLRGVLPCRSAPARRMPSSTVDSVMTLNVGEVDGSSKKDSEEFSFTSSSLSSPTSQSDNKYPTNLLRQPSSAGAALNLSDFTILGKLGEGGFGTVLLARLKSTGTLFAIKLLLKKNVTTAARAERVLREARTMQDAQHPFIVTLHGAFQDEQYIYFVLEYMGGGDLYGHMASLHSPLAQEQVRIAAAEIALAIDQLHQLGYMYRDLKAENVLIASDGHLKLADFGLAKKFSPSKQEKRAEKKITPRHSRVGTPDAVAPEIMGVGNAQKDYGLSVDWWALGILISELLTMDSVLVATGADVDGMVSRSGRCIGTFLVPVPCQALSRAF